MLYVPDSTLPYIFSARLCWLGYKFYVRSTKGNKYWKDWGNRRFTGMKVIISPFLQYVICHCTKTEVLGFSRPVIPCAGTSMLYLTFIILYISRTFILSKACSEILCQYFTPIIIKVTSNLNYFCWAQRLNNNLETKKI